MPYKFKVHGQQSSYKRDSRHTLYDAKRNQSPILSAIATFRGSGRWQKVRATEIQRHPICHDPFGIHNRMGLPVLAKSVHHIIGLLECLRLGLLERLGCLPGNLRCVCNDCHNKLEGIVDTQGEEAAKRIFISSEQEQELLIQVQNG